MLNFALLFRAYWIKAREAAQGDHYPRLKSLLPVFLISFFFARCNHVAGRVGYYNSHPCVSTALLRPPSSMASPPSPRFSARLSLSLFVSDCLLYLRHHSPSRLRWVPLMIGDLWPSAIFDPFDAFFPFRFYLRKQLKILSRRIEGEPNDLPNRSNTCKNAFEACVKNGGLSYKISYPFEIHTCISTVRLNIPIV